MKNKKRLINQRLIILGDIGHHLSFINPHPTMTIKEGQFVTLDRKGFLIPAVPGRPVVGISSTTWWPMAEMPFSIGIYHKGRFGLLVDNPDAFQIFSDVYISPDGNLSPVGLRYSRMGVVTGTFDSTMVFPPSKGVAFEFEAGGVMPAEQP